MSILAGIFIFYIVVLHIGKRVHRLTVTTYIVLGVIASIQVALVLHRLYTLEFPKP